MTNKSGNIGTRTETAIVRHLRANGFGGADEMTRADRIRLKGTHDEGDIGVCPGVMIEAKGGHTAEQASDNLIATWLDDTEVERRNRGADVAVLVLKRKGKGAPNAGAWWAFLPGWAYVYLADATAAHAGAPWLNADAYRDTRAGHLPAVRVTLADAVELLRHAGYGDPLL